jgi:hypothetical protein
MFLSLPEYFVMKWLDKEKFSKLLAFMLDLSVVSYN